MLLKMWGIQVKEKKIGKFKQLEFEEKRILALKK